MKTNMKILLVDDSQFDVMTVKHILTSLNIPAALTNANTTLQALEYLRNSNSSDNARIIVLDINISKGGGLEFLNQIKADNLLKRIPVVILTASRVEQDKIKSFNLGAVGYMLKPDNFDLFSKIIETVYRYWTTSEFPSLT